MNLDDETSEEWLEIFDYLGLFERIEIMVEDKVIPLEHVDRLYLYRIDAILDNEHIYNRLQAEPYLWLNFIKLCKLLAKRESNKKREHQKVGFINASEELEIVETMSIEAWRT